MPAPNPNFIDLDQIKLIASIIAPLASVAGLGWWLKSQFSSTKRELYQAYDDHETKDQQRHEDNLKEFGKIRVALAELGWRNGTRESAR